MYPYHVTKSYIKQITLAVGDLDVAQDFYHTVIQLDILDRTEDRSVLGQHGKPLVTLVQSNGNHVLQEGLYHIAFLLKNETQLANWLLLNREYDRFVGASHHGVSKALYLEDPDGNGIEVYTDVDDTLWNRNGEEIRMVTEPLDIEELLRHQSDDLTFDVLIGHLHLQTKDVDRAVAFYQMLGFDVTFDLSSAMFLSFNRYHHHIAFNQWNRYGMAEHDSDTTDLRSYEIWYASKDAFHQVKRNLDEQHIPYRQTGDIIVVQDPIGIDVMLSH
jgi:catechol 2,3-dioxygenase